MARITDGSFVTDVSNSFLTSLGKKSHSCRFGIISEDFLFLYSRGSNGYERIDVRFPDKNDKLVQTRYMTRVRYSACLGFDSKWLLFKLFFITSKA